MMPLGLSGQVYWLGRVDAGQSLRWQEQVYRTAADPRVAELAIDAASLHAGPDVAPFLRNVADTPDSGRGAREQAIEGLAFHPDDANLEFLVRLAGTDPDRVMRAEAVETLGELPHPAASNALRDFIRVGDPQVRAEALESLAERSQDNALVATLLDVAMSDPDPDLRKDAIELLGELPSAQSVPALERLISVSSDQEVLREVAEQLGEVGSADALAALDALIAGSPYQDVVLEALEAIADGFPRDVAGPRLEEISRRHASGVVRREALEELMDVGVDGDALLRMALQDGDADLRRDAAEHMADLPAAEAVPMLRRVAFESDDVDARRQAAESLGDVGTMEALAVLDEIIDRNVDEAASVRAVESIAESFASELAVPRLQRILADHPSIRVRREALERLADLGG
jgi:HEAT repeat protein